MASVKTHICRGTDHGTESCDYRGQNFIGALDDPRNVRQVFDAHRTIPQLEIDPADPGFIDAVLKFGPSANELYQEMAKYQPEQLGQLATILKLEGTGPVYLRTGVWDD